MKQYTVTGMSCVAAARAWKSSVGGAGCDILLGESSDEFHGCRGNRGAQEIIRAVEERRIRRCREEAGRRRKPRERRRRCRRKRC